MGVGYLVLGLRLGLGFDMLWLQLGLRKVFFQEMNVGLCNDRTVCGYKRKSTNPTTAFKCVEHQSHYFLICVDQ